MKSLLQGIHEPVINSYWFWADQFVITSSIINSKYWMINNFINLWCDSKNLPGGIYFGKNTYRNKMVEFYDCPFLEMQKIVFDNNKKIFDFGIIDFVKKSIDNEFFVLLMVDRYFIASYGFNSINYHEILIYGYDNESQKLFFCDNNKNGKFMLDLTCSYNELENAYMKFDYLDNEPDFSTSIFLFRPKEDNNYKIKISYIKKSLIDYLTFKNEDPLENDKHGIEIYLLLINFLNNIKETNILFKDIRGISVLLDHKKVMLLRLNELKNYFDFKEDYVEQYKSILEKSKIVLNLYIKYSISDSQDTLNKSIKYLSEIYYQEKYLLEKLLHEI